MTIKPRSQNHLADLLGISKSVCSAQVARGMPTDSLAAAQAWRLAHLDPARSKTHKAAPKAPSVAVATANVLMDAASAILKAGGRIDDMTPALRTAMAAVPQPERDKVGLRVEVVRVLVAHVLALVAHEDFNHGEAATEHVERMTEEDAQAAGEFWYQVAAGEVVFHEPH